MLSISGGAATLGSATPTSISNTINNQIVLGVNLSGTPNGSETLKALPASNAIFDVNGTAASTTQSNNTINLYEKILPTISQTALASDNATITVTFSEAVFDTKTASGTGYVGSGDLEKSDFAFSIALHIMGNPQKELPCNLYLTTDKDLLLSIEKDRYKMLLENDTMCSVNNTNLHIMNKFTLNDKIHKELQNE